MTKTNRTNFILLFFITLCLSGCTQDQSNLPLSTDRAIKPLPAETETTVLDTRNIDYATLLLKEEVEAILGVPVGEIEVKKTTFLGPGVDMTFSSADGKKALVLKLTDYRLENSEKRKQKQMFLELEKSMAQDVTASYEDITDLGEEAYSYFQGTDVWKNEFWINVKILLLNDKTLMREEEKKAASIVCSRL